jgi:hypothetical protein
LLSALLCAGLYPQLAYLFAPPTKKGAASSSAVKLHVRPADRTLSEPDSASVHPGSVNGELNGAEWRSCYVAFHERVKTTKVYMRDSTPVPPLAMLLLAGGDLKREPGAGKDGQQLYATGGDGSDEILALDGFYRLHVPSDAAELVMQLRERIQGLVRRLIDEVEETPKGRRGNHQGAGGRGFHQAHNGPAPLSSGDKEGETIVRDTVEVLDKISEWKDVKVVPELSPHEKKKLEAQRRHAAKVAEQRRLKQARAQEKQRQIREAAAARRAGRGAGKGGGRGGGGRGGGGRGGGGRGRWNNKKRHGGGGGGGGQGGGGGGDGAPNAKRHKRF